MTVCGLKPLSVKNGAPITDRTGKVSLSFLYHLEAINPCFLKYPTFFGWQVSVLFFQNQVLVGVANNMVGWKKERPTMIHPMLKGHNNWKMIDFFGRGVFNFQLNFTLNRSIEKRMDKIRLFLCWAENNTAGLEKWTHSS